ncbi:MAG: DUF547 domain-containing protein [SAR324 cluster bacterium]|nr:DUF547 domain-containing protein [SAR324 cluster bacterium]
MKHLILLTYFVFNICVSSGFAAPKSELWSRWQKHNPQSNKIIEHSAWQSFLDKYLVVSDLQPQLPASGINRVRYNQVSKQESKQLQNYLSTLEKTAVSNYARLEQRAFWINLYNAATVNLILEHYPVESITKISFSFFSFGPWDEKLLTVEEEELSLNDIEHRILRPIWQDHRIHYALNCASLGCPNLLQQAFTAQNTESLLDQGAVEYINHPRGAKKDGNILRLSKIYEWYQADFGGNEAGVLRHLQKYAGTNLAKSLNAAELEIEYHYDWQLNEPNY